MEKKRVGVIGGGQLAWMTATAAQDLDIELIVQTPSENDPAAKLAQDVVLAPINDAHSTAKLASMCDVITFENEFIDLAALESLAQEGVCFRPSLASLSPLLDKYHQRSYFQSIGLPVPKFIALNAQPDMISELGYPVVLKTRRHGYDGQGTFILNNSSELAKLGQRCQNQPIILEEYVPFAQELATIAVRSATGEMVVYPVVETQQEEQVCRRVIAPAHISPQIKSQVEAIAYSLLENLEFVGAIGIELFLTKSGNLLVNEIAPRTHNSGHYTIDACYTSQFTMHLQAVTGLKLTSPELKVKGAVMVNLLGYEDSLSDYRDKRATIANIPHSYLHWYDKTPARPGRKLGHVTVLLDEEDIYAQAQAIALTIEDIWTN